MISKEPFQMNCIDIACALIELYSLLPLSLLRSAVRGIYILSVGTLKGKEEEKRNANDES